MDKNKNSKMRQLLELRQSSRQRLYEPGTRFKLENRDGKIVMIRLAGV